MDVTAAKLRPTTYLPAVGGMQTTEKESFHISKFWWNKKKCLIFYPRMLVSYHFRGGDMFDDIRKRWQIDKDVWILGDSGGFSRVSTGESVNVMRVLRWAEANNVDSQISLDYPPYKMGVGQTFGARLSDREFNRRMRISNEDANIMFEKRENEKLEIYGVIQGSSLDEINNWFKGLTKDHKFHGYAMAPKAAVGAPLRVARYLGFSIQNFPKAHTHFLQITGKNTMPICIYAQKKGYLTGRMTCDSATWAQGSISRSFLATVADMKWVRMKAKQYDKDHYETPFLPCNCPVCSSIPTFKDMPETEIGQIISLHNLFYLSQYSGFIEGLLEHSEEEFRNYIKKYCSKECLNAINAVDDMAEGMEIEKAIRKNFLGNKSLEAYAS